MLHSSFGYFSAYDSTQQLVGQGTLLRLLSSSLYQVQRLPDCSVTAGHIPRLR